MRVLIVGCGLVGKELARQLRADGHVVVGTTTTAAKVAGAERGLRRGRGPDRLGHREGARRRRRAPTPIVVAAGPAAAQAMTVEQRQRTYRQVLVDTAESVATRPRRAVPRDAVVAVRLRRRGEPPRRHRRVLAADRRRRPEPGDVPGGGAHLPRRRGGPAGRASLRRRHRRRGPADHGQAAHGAPGARRLRPVLRRGAVLPGPHARRRRRDQARRRPPDRRHVQPHAPRGPAGDAAVLRRDVRARRPAAADVPQRAARRRRSRCPSTRCSRTGFRLTHTAGRVDAERRRHRAAERAHRDRPHRPARSSTAALERITDDARPRRGARRGRRRGAPADRRRRTARRPPDRRVPGVHARRTASASSTARSRSTSSAWTPTRSTRSRPRRAPCRTSSSTPRSRRTPTARSTSASTSSRASTSARRSTTPRPSTARSPKPRAEALAAAGRHAGAVARSAAVVGPLAVDGRRDRRCPRT